MSVVDLDKGHVDVDLEQGFASVLDGVPFKKGHALEEKPDIARRTVADIAQCYSFTSLHSHTRRCLGCNSVTIILRC